MSQPSPYSEQPALEDLRSLLAALQTALGAVAIWQDPRPGAPLGWMVEFDVEGGRMAHPLKSLVPYFNPNGPRLPEYKHYDGPRATQRLHYTANVLDVLQAWLADVSVDVSHELQRLRNRYRERAAIALEDAWPK